MFTSESENVSWEYIPPRKLQTTLLEDSPNDSKDFSITTWKNSEQFNKRFPMLVTPKDLTRTNSPIQMPSPIFSDDEESEGLRTLYEQLILIKDRHATLKTYINSIRAQLQQSFNLGIAELQGKRNVLISQIDLIYDEAFNKLCMAHKEKEVKIQAKDQELENSLEELENVIQKIEIYGGESEKVSKEIENSLKIWVSESEVSGEWAILPIPEFNITVIHGKKEHRKESHKSRKEDPQFCSSGKHKLKKHADSSYTSSKSRNRSHHEKVDLKKVETLEKNVCHTFRPPTSKRIMESNLDLNLSEGPISISTLYSTSSDVHESENQIKIFIPQGYPSYACFYLVKVTSKITIAEVLAKLNAHMGVNKDKYGLRLGSPDSKGKNIESKRKAIEYVSKNLFLV